MFIKLQTATFASTLRIINLILRYSVGARVFIQNINRRIFL